MIIAALLAALLVQMSADPVDDLAARLVARLVATPAAQIIRLAPGDDARALVEVRGLSPARRVTVYTLDATLPGLGYRRIGESRLRDLPSLLRSIGSQRDVFISLSPRPPRFALAFGDGSRISTEARRLFGSALVARVAGEAPLVLDDGFQVFGAAFPLIGDELEAIRPRVRSAQLQGLVYAVLYRGSASLRLACQIIAADPGDDDLFSIEVALTPELAALLQATPASGDATQALMARLPLMDDALAVCALDADGEADADIAVLTPGEILFFHHGEAGLQPFRAISLGNLTPAVYPTRAPAGSITPADVDGDGRNELLIAANVFALGAVLYPADGYRVEELSGAPVAAVPEEHGDEVVSSEYIAGTDYFGGRTFLGDGKGRNRVFEPGPSGMMRRLITLPGRDSVFLVLTPDWRLLLQQAGERPRSISAGPGEISAITAGAGRIAIAILNDGEESRIEIGMPSGGRFEAETSASTTLDIRDLAIYNSAIHSATYIAVLGREDGVGMVLEVRRLPSVVGE